ncbi:54S ribosomal protein L28, mitochondrial [Madurella fahalii]|uniref:Large ribosomal subunit protein mL40 n=1 Tax=Madurella fahalii TaxID=1157608 RepID=A0ABQ0GLG8_9PEZI
MSFSLISLRGLASRLLAQRPTMTIAPSPIITQCRTRAPARAFSTTPISLAFPGQKGGKPSGGAKGAKASKAKKGRGRGKRGNEPSDPKMMNMALHFKVLTTRRIPAPLRMARNRHLRHWTIHRAWLLFRRREREARERTLMRQYQSMNEACEELRLTAGPGTRDEGYLYRVAMEKKGVYGLNGVPIEYARAQTETPARVAWDHDWKRS